MKVLRSLDGVDRPPSPAVATIGVFDGVHVGHRRIVQRLVDEAAAREAVPVLFTFEPHPRTVLADARSPRILTTLDEKTRILGDLGVVITFVLRFDRAFADTPAEEFVRTYLVEPFRLSHLIVGYDFRLGRDREGNGGLIAGLGRTHGFTVETVDHVDVEGKPVKSTRIRDEIEEGRVDVAARLLTRYHTVRGIVETGDGRGRTLGFPTANIHPSAGEKLLPAGGVYAAFVEWSGTIREAVVNIGTRPTFGPGGEATVEAHLIGHEADLVGADMALHFVRRLRGEKRFPSKDALVAQIGRDQREAEMTLTEGDRRFVFTAF